MLHFDSQVIPYSLDMPTGRDLPHTGHEKSSGATIEVLNNDQSVNLIPEMGSCDYKFLNPRSRDR